MERFKLGFGALICVAAAAAITWSLAIIIAFLIDNWYIGKWVFGGLRIILVAYVLGWAIEAAAE